MAEQYARWDPSVKIISLRFSNVMLPQEYETFEGWQNDPKARYWNCWGYIGQFFLYSFVRLALGRRRCFRSLLLTTTTSQTQEMVDRQWPCP